MKSVCATCWKPLKRLCLLREVERVKTWARIASWSYPWSRMSKSWEKPRPAYPLAAREQSPAIPWDEIIGMRNRLIHAYFDVNLDIVWETVQDDVPRLISLIEPLVPPETTQGTRAL